MGYQIRAIQKQKRFKNKTDMSDTAPEIPEVIYAYPIPRVETTGNWHLSDNLGHAKYILATKHEECVMVLEQSKAALLEAQEMLGMLNGIGWFQQQPQEGSPADLMDKAITTAEQYLKGVGR